MVFPDQLLISFYITFRLDKLKDVLSLQNQKCFQVIVYLHTNHDLIEPRLRYVLDYIQGHPICSGQVNFITEDIGVSDIQINYGGNQNAHFPFIPVQLKFFNKHSSQSGALFINSYLFEGAEVYSVEKEMHQGKVFFDQSNFGFDIFETIFFHLSRYEEYFYQAGMLDQNDMLIVRNNLEQIPVVDQLVIAFCKCLGIAVKTKSTKFNLTHDIDKIYKFNNLMDIIKALAWPIVNKFDFSWAIRNLKMVVEVKKRKEKDPYDSYDFLLRKSKVWTKKVIYFMGGGKTRFDLFDNNYKKDLPGIIKMARETGYEFGIHPSYDTADNQQMMLDEKTWLGKMCGEEISHTRQHFLHFISGTTDEHIDKVGFDIDSTIGFTRKIGFRSGTGFEYHLYDFKNEKPFSFREMPLVVMDSSLVHQSADDMDEFKKILFEFVQKNKTGTQITFNFHNSTFDTSLKSRKKLKSIFENLELYLENLLG